MTEKLIELVRKYPCLYNTKLNSYKNIAIKTKLWAEIGEQINETGEAAKTKWKSLRDNYVRYKREVAGTTGQAAKKKITEWPWASQLQFLDSTLTDRERSSNVRKAPSPDIETPSPDVETPSPEIQLPETPQPETPPPETPHANSINRSRAKKNQKTNSEMDKVINFIQNKKKKEYGAIDHLFQSYAQTFKTFSKDKQIKAKLELAKLFASIEAEELQGNAQTLSNSPQYSIISTEDSVVYEVTNSTPEDLSPVAVIDLSNISTSSYQQQPEQLRQPLHEIDMVHVTNYGASTSSVASSYQQQPEQLRQPLHEIDMVNVTNYGASTSSVDFHNDNAINMYFKK